MAILPRRVVHFDEVSGAKPAPKVFCVHVNLLMRSVDPSLSKLRTLRLRNQENPTLLHLILFLSCSCHT